MNRDVLKIDALLSERGKSAPLGVSCLEGGHYDASGLSAGDRVSVHTCQCATGVLSPETDYTIQVANVCGSRVRGTLVSTDEAMLRAEMEFDIKFVYRVGKKPTRVNPTV